LVAVAVEVAGRDGARVGADRVAGLVREATLADAEQHRDVVGAEVGSDQVGVAVAVEVADRDGVGAGADWVCDLVREAARAVAEQHRDVVGVDVPGDQVGVAVAVEVADCDGEGGGADRVGDLVREAARAVAEKHRDVVGEVVGGDQVLVAVAVEVADRDGVGGVADRVGGLVLEAARTVAEQHRDVAVAVEVFVGSDQVLVAVAVEVAGRDGARVGADRVVGPVEGDRSTSRAREGKQDEGRYEEQGTAPGRTPEARGLAGFRRRTFVGSGRAPRFAGKAGEGGHVSPLTPGRVLIATVRAFEPTEV
jgi:hypothetical protein